MEPSTPGPDWRLAGAVQASLLDSRHIFSGHDARGRRDREFGWRQGIRSAAVRISRSRSVTKIVHRARAAQRLAKSPAYKIRSDRLDFPSALDRDPSDAAGAWCKVGRPADHCSDFE